MSNAVVRLHDANIEDKFIEIGMGGIPQDRNFWVAIQLPDDEGYVVVHNKLDRGWLPRSQSHSGICTDTRRVNSKQWRENC